MTGNASNLLKPPAVEPGAAIGIVAPASFAKSERIDQGLAQLRSQGFTPLVSKNALERGPLFFAGSLEQRLEDLHQAFADPNSGAVMCLRGGYGSNYLL